MASRTSMLHVRVDDRLKVEAAERLSNVGLTISDAVRILLTRVAREGSIPRRMTLGSGRRFMRLCRMLSQRPRIVT
jgi:DNA-damage-inducible protein J